MKGLKKKLAQADFSRERQERLKSAIRDMRAQLQGQTINLSPEERRKYSSIRHRNLLFIEKIRGFLAAEGELLRPQIDADDFEQRYEMRSFLYELVGLLRALLEQLDDTRIAIDYELQSTALLAYQYIKLLAKQDIPGIDTWHADLKAFFTRPARKEVPSEELPPGLEQA